MRAHELHQLHVIHARQFQDPAPRGERDLRVAERRVRLEDDLAIGAVHECANDPFELVGVRGGEVVVRDHDAAVLEVVRGHLTLKHRILDAPRGRRRGDARGPVLSGGRRLRVVVARLPDRDVVSRQEVDLRADRRARRKLRHPAHVCWRRRRLEHTGRAQARESEHDRQNHHTADEELIEDPRRLRRASRLTLPFLLFAPFAAKLGGHALQEYRPKLASP